MGPMNMTETFDSLMPMVSLISTVSLLLSLLPPLFLTGCWDKKDPEDRAFIMTLGVDDTAEGCKFIFAPANTGDGETQTYTAESETLAGAVAKVDGQMSRKTDLGQLKTIILSGELLEDSRKLDSLLQELERSQTVSEKVMLLATEESAADCVDAVMAAVLPLPLVPAM